MSEGVLDNEYDMIKNGLNSNICNESVEIERNWVVLAASFFILAKHVPIPTEIN